MDKIDLLLEDIKKEIYSEPYVQEYLRLKEVIKGDERLSRLEKEIRVHQKAMCDNKSNPEVLSKERDLYEKAFLEFESDPIVKDYKIVKEEVYNLLAEVKGVLD